MAKNTKPIVSFEESLGKLDKTHNVKAAAGRSLFFRSATIIDLAEN